MTTLATTTAPPRRLPPLVRLLAAAATAAVTLAGVWLAGGIVTNDFTVAMWLIPAWLALAGAAALAIGARVHPLRLPVVGAYALAAAALGAWLGAAMFLDRTVNEQVATAGGGNELVRTGSLEAVRHAARGEARIVELAGGGRVLTLTDLAVDNGPDLRLYLVAGPAATEDDVTDLVDLGALKGNRGNQQYALPDGLDLDRYATAVVWCRAFSVLFARAPLGREESR
jgi:hypothetical protein